MGLKVNAKKLFFGQIDTEYIYFLVYNNGLRHLSYIVDASKSIYVRTEVRDMSRFVGIFNKYIDMGVSAHIHCSLKKTMSN